MTPRLKVRPEDVEWREVDGEVVVLDLRTLLYLAINPSGAILWPSLVEGATKETLVARLRDTFEIGDDQATEDVDAFLQALEERDLLERVES